MSAGGTVARGAPDVSLAERARMDGAIACAVSACADTGQAGIAASVQRNARTIATSENELSLQSDPTRHAEVVAITRAAHRVGTIHLSDCRGAF